MRPGEIVGSVVLESTEEIDLTFDAVDQMELDLASEKVTEDDTERLTQLLSNAEDEIALSAEDSTVALTGLELAVWSDWMKLDKKHKVGQMLNDYNRKRLQSR